jgi:hypothetical protein
MPDAGGVAVDWFRFYNEVRGDRKLDALTDPQVRVWLFLLCYANEQDPRGTIPPTDAEELAVECARGDEELLTATIAKLIKPLKIVERLEDGSLHFINWEKRQFISDDVTRRTTKHMSKRSMNVQPTPTERSQIQIQSTDTDTEEDNTPPTPSKGEFTQDFESFWTLYPKRKNNNKQAAFRWWKTKLTNGATVAELILAVRAYARDREGEPSKFTKMASTFLGPDDHWKEYLGQEERPIQQYPDPTEEYREEWERAGVNR